MIREDEILKEGHSAIAAARKHAKFLRDNFDMDLLSANAETIELLREIRDAALSHWDEDKWATASGTSRHTCCTVHIEKDGLMRVFFSVPTSSASERLR